jgi:hypothetical protein
MTDEEFNRQVAERVAELERTGGFTDFSGQNCEQPCLGWDGKSRRCDCGNRRVTWTCNVWSDSIYAEAW